MENGPPNAPSYPSDGAHPDAAAPAAPAAPKRAYPSLERLLLESVASGAVQSADGIISLLHSTFAAQLRPRSALRDAAFQIYIMSVSSFPVCCSFLCNLSLQVCICMLMN